MAGGPLYPSSLKVEDSPNIFGDVFIPVPAGNGHEVEVIGIIANLGSDVKMFLELKMPNPLPTGQLKLVMTALAHAVANVAKHNPAIVMVDDEEDSSEATLVAEGVETTTWAAGDDGVNKITKTNLDAVTIEAGKLLVCHVTFLTLDWTQNVNVGWKRPEFVWE